MNASPRDRRIGLVTASSLALCGCVWLGWSAPQAMLSSYLAAWVFFLAPALGSVALSMVHVLAGDGQWGHQLRMPLLAAAGVLPLLGLLLVPVLVGAAWLYPWLQPAYLAGPLAAQQRWYLNLPFFELRAVGCVALWLWLARGMRRRLLDARATSSSLRCFAAGGLIVYALSVSIAAVDWVMSLMPAWHSSIFGLIVASGQLLAAAALAVYCHSARGDDLQPAQRRDLGSLLLVLTLAWSYLAFMDYLTAWIADLPAETVWYLPRLSTSWRWLGVALVVFHLALPFAVLLSRRAKEHRRWLRGVALMLLLAQAGYVSWLVLPDFRVHGFALGWSDLLAWFGIGGLCWCAFDARLARARVDAEAQA